jgi:hypothetical protein
MATSFTDCGGDGCGECDVCRRLDFLEWVGQVSGGVAHTIEPAPELDKYIERKHSAGSPR